MQLLGNPDLLSFTRRNRVTSDIKARLDIAAQEAVTGQRADLTAATNGRIGDVHLLNKALNDIEQGTRINSLSSNRLDLISLGISGARAAINGLDSRAIIAVNSDNQGLESIIEEAEGSLRSVIQSFSGKHGTRNLFSGDATDTPAFAGADALLDDIRNIISTAGSPNDINTALDTYFNDPAGGFQTNIYTGGQNAAAPLQIGNGQIIEVDVRGDHQAIKDVLRGLAVIATVESAGQPFESEEFKEIIGGGITATANGISGLIQFESDVGVSSEILEQANSRNQFESSSLTAAYQNLIGRDQFEAVAELQQLEVQLESSYIITARLSDLSLTNYLR